MRKRGIRGGRGRGAAPRGLEALCENPRLGLRDLKLIDRPDGAPSDVYIGSANRPGPFPLAVAIGRRPGVDLLGWARVAAALIEDTETAPIELCVVAPMVTSSMRDAAAWMARTGPPYRLAAFPPLADSSENVVSMEWVPASADPGARSVSTELLQRVLRCIDGAAAVTCSGGVRKTELGHVLYVRGTLVLEVTAAGDGVLLEFTQPDRRQVHVTDASFPRWGPELHDQIVQIAQDPRLLDGEAAARHERADEAARAAGAQMTSRWMPNRPGGADPVDWLGIDGDARPILGFVRSGLRLSDVPGVTAALYDLDRDRALWVPGASGRPRVLFSGAPIDETARELIEGCQADVEVIEGMESGTRSASERRGRRRSRRRRRGRGDEGGIEPTAADTEELDVVASGERQRAADGRVAASEPPLRRSRSRDGQRARRRPERERSREDSEARGRDVEREAAERGQRAEPRPAETRRSSEDRQETGAPEPIELESSGYEEPTEAATPPEGATAPSFPSSPVEEEGDLAAGEVDESEELAIAESLEEVDAEIDDSVAEEVSPPIAVPPRRRRPRAAIVVRNDPSSILTALILARERRNILFFFVCAQHELMDFFRGKATDIDENTDLLLVDFTAQPVPGDLITAAEVYAGQILWFDHHEWPVEDLERLRAVLPEESVYVSEEAASSLAAIMDLSERRSRFTDKLLDLSGARLSENDMARWGYRLIGLIQKMTEHSGDHRQAIQPILAGKPSELSEVEDVYTAESAWLAQHEPRVVCFGEYEMAVGHVPGNLDAGEIGRRLRMITGARLSLASREGDSVVLIGYNEEKRHMNVMGLVEHLNTSVPWLHARPGGDRIGRIEIDDLPHHPERLEAMIGEIVRHKSFLYG